MVIRLIATYAYFAPEKAASSYLWENLHEDFAKSGVECVVYAPMPTRGLTAKEKSQYNNRRIETYYGGKLIIHRFRLYREGKNSFLRALRYTFNCLILFNKCMTSKDSRSGNVLFSVSTPPIIGLVGACVNKFRKIGFVYNLQDIFPDSLVGNCLARKGGILWKIGRVIEDFTYKHADKIIVISQDFKKNIMAKGVPEDKIVVVYNWVDENAVKDVNRPENSLFDKYCLDRSNFYLSYSGNIGLSQNMDMLLQVMKELQSEQPDIRLVLVGDGAYKEKVIEIVAREGIKNVDMLPFQPYEQISEVFSLGDVGLVISKPGVGANSVPSKTWSIMSASRPVLANFDENEMKSIIEDNNCGIFTKAGDKDAFKAAILKLYGNRELAVEMGGNGRKFVLDNLTREVGTGKYLDVIKSVLSSKS